MKWSRETKVYMWANYYSEDGKWVAWDEDVLMESGKRKYNPKTRKMEAVKTLKCVWFLKNLQTGEKVNQEFKTLKAAKEYAENA